MPVLRRSVMAGTSPRRGPSSRRRTRAAGPSTSAPGAIVEMGSGATGGGVAPHSVSHWSTAPTTSRRRCGRARPRRAPPRTSGSAHRRCIRSRVARSCGVRLSAAQRAIANSGWRVASPPLTRLRSSKSDLAVSVDEDRAERLVAVVEGLAREVHASRPSGHDRRRQWSYGVSLRTRRRLPQASATSSRHAHDARIGTSARALASSSCWPMIVASASRPSRCRHSW